MKYLYPVSDAIKVKTKTKKMKFTIFFLFLFMNQILSDQEETSDNKGVCIHFWTYIQSLKSSETHNLISHYFYSSQAQRAVFSLKNHYVLTFSYKKCLA